MNCYQENITRNSLTSRISEQYVYILKERIRLSSEKDSTKDEKSSYVDNFCIFNFLLLLFVSLKPHVFDLQKQHEFQRETYSFSNTQIVYRDSAQLVSQLSRSVMSDSLRPHESQQVRPPCPSPTPRVHPNSYASSR